MTSRTKSRLMRPRFTLAALLLLLTIISPPLAYVAQRRAWNLKRKVAYESLKVKGIDLTEHMHPTIAAPSSLSRWQQQLLLEDAAPKVKSLHFARSRHDDDTLPPLTDDDLRQLALFVEIENITLTGSRAITDAGLAEIMTLPNLRRLQVGFMPNVKGEFLQHLPRSSPIESIILSNLNQLSGDSLNTIAELGQLKSLWLDRCALLTDESLRGVELPPQVHDLLIDRCPLGDETLARWLKNRQLHRFNLGAKITRRSAVALATQRELVQLAIINAPLVDEDFRFLANCPDLVNLSIEAAPVRGELLNSIACPEKVEHLRFDSTLFEDRHLAALKKFTQLVSVDLNWTPLTGEGFESLIVLPGQCRVSLAGTQFTDRGKDALGLTKGEGVSNLDKVTLPSNWRFADFHRFYGGVKPTWPIGLNVSEVSEATKTTGVHYEWYKPAELSKNSEPLSNCPADLMVPVIRLHELARANEEAEQKALTEYLGGN